MLAGEAWSAVHSDIKVLFGKIVNTIGTRERRQYKTACDCNVDVVRLLIHQDCSLVDDPELDGDHGVVKKVSKFNRLHSVELILLFIRER